MSLIISGVPARKQRTRHRRAEVRKYNAKISFRLSHFSRFLRLRHQRKMDQSELAFIDGTHPALLGNAPAPSSPRSQSPTTRSSRTLSASSASSASSTSSSPRFSAVDPDPPTQSVNPKFNPKAGNGGASNTGPKGVIADWKNSQIGVASQHGKNLEGLIKLGTGPGEAPGLFSLDAGTGRGGVDIVQRREDGDEEERAKEAYRERRKDELRGSGERVMKGKVFGHLREIGIHQFLNAIEDDSGIAVVIHLYEPVNLPLPPSSSLFLSPPLHPSSFDSETNEAERRSHSKIAKS